MFKLLRYYSAASLVAVIATAGLLVWLYREVAIQGTLHLARLSSLSLAQATLTPIKTHILEFLEAAERSAPGSSPRLPPELARSIDTAMQDRFVVRVKIFNREGVVLFSTKPDQVGHDEGHNKRFLSAIQGGVGSALIYRDSLNPFDEPSEEDNLSQTYLPVRAGPSEPIEGVFEVYADVQNLMHQAERLQFIGIGGAILILSGLYGTLFLVVRRANKTIEQQQQTIRERNQTLELLSSHMLKNEESGKQKIAHELHEGVAQTLAALKMQMESKRLDTKGTGKAPASPDPLVPVLQHTIQEVRDIATRLRPATLDDLGLLATLDALCRDLQHTHPDVHVERAISVQEEDVPPPLKVILYRIILSVLDDVRRVRMGKVDLALRLEGDHVALLLTLPACASMSRMEGIARMEELATLSGGEFTSSPHAEGGMTLRASWDSGACRSAGEAARVALSP